MKANERWLENYRREHPGRVQDPNDERREKESGIIRTAEWYFTELPPLLNVVMRLFKHNHHEYSRKIDHWATELSLKAREDAGPGAIIATPTTLHMVRHSKSVPDVDGLYGSFKMILDGLVRCGLLPDDNPDAVANISADHCKIKSGEQKGIKLLVREQT